MDLLSYSSTNVKNIMGPSQVLWVSQTFLIRTQLHTCFVFPFFALLSVDGLEMSLARQDRFCSSFSFISIGSVISWQSVSV